MSNDIEQALVNSILHILRPKKWISEIALPDKVKRNYIYVKPVVDYMIENKIVTHVGDDYEEKYRKIFRSISSRPEAEQYKRSIQYNQYKRQTEALVKRLVSSLLEHNNIHQIIEESEMILAGKSFIDKRFHALTTAEIITAYNLVITKREQAINDLHLIIYQKQL